MAATYAEIKGEYESAQKAAAVAQKAFRDATAKLRDLAPELKRAGLVNVAVLRDGKTIYHGPVAKAPKGEIVAASESHKIALSIGKARADYGKELGFCLRDAALGLNVAANEARAALLIGAGIEAAKVPNARPPKNQDDPTMAADVYRRALLIIEKKLPRSEHADAAVLADAILAAREEAIVENDESEDAVPMAGS